jgi:leader peptidase (prepilin peptidase)/N-methyltransferase
MWLVPRHTGVAPVSPAEARWLVVATGGAVGLVFGSFLNVVVYRAPRHLSVVSPGSFCPQCSTPVRPYDNVPVVSWLVLRGRCRACRAPISPRYPLVEAGTGLLFALVAAAVGPHPAAVGLCALGAALAASLAIELDGEAVPPAVPAVGGALGLAALAGSAAANGHWAHLVGAVVGAGAGVLAAAITGRSAVRASPRAEPWRSATWVLLPAGTVLGWSVPVGAAVGGGLLVVGLVAGLLFTADGSRRAGRASPWGRVGPATISAAAAVTAVVAAVGAGTGLF